MFNSRDSVDEVKENKNYVVELPYPIGTIVSLKENENELMKILQYRILEENNMLVKKVALSSDIYDVNPSIEKEITVEKLMEDYVETKKIIITSIDESELIHIPEILEYYKNDKSAVFNNSKYYKNLTPAVIQNLSIFKNSDYDVDNFLRIYPESRKLTMEEVKCLKALCEMSVIFNSLDDIILGTGRSSCTSCLFKTYESIWVTWETDERRGFSDSKAFLNVHDACINIIYENVLEEEIDNALKYFNFLLKQDIDEESLLEFADTMQYEINPSKIKKIH